VCVCVGGGGGGGGGGGYDFCLAAQMRYQAVDHDARKERHSVVFKCINISGMNIAKIFETQRNNKQNIINRT
jgi:hypothetical protein